MPTTSGRAFRGLMVLSEMVGRGVFDIRAWVAWAAFGL